MRVFQSQKPSVSLALSVTTQPDCGLHRTAPCGAQPRSIGNDICAVAFDLLARYAAGETHTADQT